MLKRTDAMAKPWRLPFCTRAVLEETLEPEQNVMGQDPRKRKATVPSFQNQREIDAARRAMLGKRDRSVVMPRTASLASMPPVPVPVPKQARQQEGGGDESLAAGVRAAASFLATCGWCGTGLGPGKDTYIYRGEVAFCSHECRERQIKKDGQHS